MKMKEKKCTTTSNMVMSTRHNSWNEERRKEDHTHIIRGWTTLIYINGMKIKEKKSTITPNMVMSNLKE
jgi:hypothetical protein